MRNDGSATFASSLVSTAFATAWKENLFHCLHSAFRDASIHRLSVLQLSDFRYKHRSNQSTTILEQFLRGKGSQAAILLLVKGPYRDYGDLHWQFTLLPLTNIIGQLL